MVRYAEWHEANGSESFLDRVGGLAMLFGASMFALVGFVVCCGVGALPGFFFGWNLTGRERTRRRLERLRDTPTRYAQHACRISLEWCGMTYGRDEGLVSFVDGTMLYEGRRTTFSAVRGQLAVSHRSDFGFIFGDLGCHCTLLPLSRGEFRTAMDEWLRTDPAAIEYAVLPPICAQPGREKLSTALMSAAWVVGSFGSAAIAVSVALAQDTFLVAAMFTLVVAGSLVYASLDDRQTLRSLAEVRQALRQPEGAVAIVRKS